MKAAHGQNPRVSNRHSKEQFVEPSSTEFNTAVQVYVEQLARFDLESKEAGGFDAGIFQAFVDANQAMMRVCAELQQRSSVKDVKAARQYFQAQIEPWISKSYFGCRLGRWPRGYPGDFETLEALYQGYPPTREGIGLLFDLYALSRQLGVGIRERRATLRELLASELAQRPQGTRVMNVACGSCRELFELSEQIRLAGPRVTCIDHDPDALEYARRLLAGGAMSLSNFSFIKHDALRMENQQENQQRFGAQEIIYSAGLFDYIPDKLLAKLLTGLYELLEPGGKLIAPFKDRLRYEPTDYHWLANWRQFFQRTEQDVQAIFARAGIAAEAIQTSRDNSGIMIFFIVSR